MSATFPVSYTHLIEKFAKHITSHGSVYSRADISAILYIAVDCMREMLLEGKKIRLGDLGDFSLLLTSKGAEDADKFTAQNITGVKVQWEPGQEFKNLRDDAEFNLVALSLIHILNGERWALSGQNGAGKSTLLSLVCADNPQSYADVYKRQRLPEHCGWLRG